MRKLSDQALESKVIEWLRAVIRGVGENSRDFGLTTETSLLMATGAFAVACLARNRKPTNGELKRWAELALVAEGYNGGSAPSDSELLKAAVLEYGERRPELSKLTIRTASIVRAQALTSDPVVRVSDGAAETSVFVHLKPTEDSNA